MWGEVAFAFAPSCFSREAGYIAANHPRPIKQAKLASGLDTNNFNPSLTTKYHHTATESLYQLRGAKISWAPTLARVSQQFGFVRFPISHLSAMQDFWIISFFYLFPMKIRIIK